MSYICNRCLENLADKQITTMTSTEGKYLEVAGKNESKSDISTFCQRKNDMSSDNLPAIVGLLVTVIVLLILIGLAVILFFRLRNKRLTKRQKGNFNTYSA